MAEDRRTEALRAVRAALLVELAEWTESVRTLRRQLDAIEDELMRIEQS